MAAPLAVSSPSNAQRSLRGSNLTELPMHSMPGSSALSHLLIVLYFLFFGGPHLLALRNYS